VLSDWARLSLTLVNAQLRLMPMVSIVWCANVLQEKSPDIRPLMTSSPGLSLLQICWLQRSRKASQYLTTKDQMVKLFCLGKRVSRSPGTLPSSVLWLCRYVSGYSPGASAELAAARKCESMPICPTPTFSSP